MSLRVALALAVLFSLAATTVLADGSLRPGQVVVLRGAGHVPTLFRINPNSPFFFAETISTEAMDEPWDLAIAGPNTVFVASLKTDGQRAARIWEVDVRYGTPNEFVTIPVGANILVRGVAVEPDGNLLLLLRDPTIPESTLMRVDRSDPTSQQVVATGTHFDRKVEVGADGSIYIADILIAPAATPGITRVEPSDGSTSRVVPVYTGAFGWVSMEMDYATGELVVPGSIDTPPAADVVRFHRLDPFNKSASLVIEMPLAGNYIPGVDFGIEPTGNLVYPRDEYLTPQVEGAILRLNVGDGSTDIMNDLPKVGGDAVSDGMIAVEVVGSQCSNGLDDDGDGKVDSADPHCSDSSDDREATACSDGLDNDIDTLVDLDDPDCAGDSNSDGEIKACNDGIDNDGDGQPDRFDLQCDDAGDDQEGFECSDGVDNNGDGFVDLEDPFICFHEEWNCEKFYWLCPGTTPKCSDGWDNDGQGDVDFPEDPDCASPYDNSELPACDDGQDNDNDGFVDIHDTECDEYESHAELPQCNDGIDNNADGWTDWPEDPGCEAITDDSELAACQDGIDNDDDGKTDFLGLDPDCDSPLDPTESPRACSDGVDNDSDGKIDGEDPDCRNGADPSEQPRQCSDGVDNDGDGKVDFPLDTNCASHETVIENAAPGLCGLIGIELLIPLAFAFRRRKCRT